MEHPCVGMVQKASIWGKAKEMLILKDVLGRLPDVTFYWAGDGPHAGDITDKLGKYPISSTSGHWITLWASGVSSPRSTCTLWSVAWMRLHYLPGKP